MLLMHRDIPVAKMQMVGSKPVAYQEIYLPEQLPIGTIGKTKEQEQLLISHWYKSRAVPNLRPGMEKIESQLVIYRAEAFLKSAGVSLTDMYWIKEEEDDISWSDINYHSNGFEPVFAKAILGNKTTFSPSPDFTTDGVMEKFWFPITGIPHLYKIDRIYHDVLCANEVVYHQIADSVGVETTPYFDGVFEETHFCMCPCFVKNDSCDYVSAMQIKHLDFTTNGDKLIRYFTNNLGFNREIKEMLTLDCVLGNTDRHEKNFGFLQFEDGTRKFVPLFDNGSCLNYDYNPICSNKKEMKPTGQYREQIMEQYGLPLEFDRICCEHILERVYSDFQIPEEQFFIAITDLRQGILLAEQCRQKHFPGKSFEKCLNNNQNKEDYEHAHE